MRFISEKATRWHFHIRRGPRPQVVGGSKMTTHRVASKCKTLRVHKLRRCWPTRVKFLPSADFFFGNTSYVRIDFSLVEWRREHSIHFRRTQLIHTEANNCPLQARKPAKFSCLLRDQNPHRKTQSFHAIFSGMVNVQCVRFLFSVDFCALQQAKTVYELNWNLALSTERLTPTTTETFPPSSTRTRNIGIS